MLYKLKPVIIIVLSIVLIFMVSLMFSISKNMYQNGDDKYFIIENTAISDDYDKNIFK